MTHEQLKKRFKELQGVELGKGAPWEFSRRTARRALLKELMDSGVSNHEAVFVISKAEKEVRNERN